MILKRIYEFALPRLSGKRIRDVRIGLSLMAVELDDGSLGVTYVLREEIGHTCTALPGAGSFQNMPADAVAAWAVNGDNVLAISLGLAVLNSVAEFDQLQEENDPCRADAASAVEIQATDTVGIVGHIGPVIANMESKARRMLIFERGDRVPGPCYPESAEPELLPECQVVFVSGTSLINGTLETLLGYCAKAREIVMVGSSTPLYPDAFRDTRVIVLSGTRWLSSRREAILTAISQCAGMRELIRYGQKMSVRVKR